MTDLDHAVATLLAARKGEGRPAALPAGAVPASWEEAYAIQDEVARRLGPVVGWKVGATTPEAEPFRAPIHADTLLHGDAGLTAASFNGAGLNVIGVEAELCYRFDRDLPPRETPYTEEEVSAAIGFVHAAIEVVDTRYAEWNSVDRLSQVADQMNHGLLVIGTGRPDWAAIDPPNHPVALRIDGAVAAEGIGGNTAGHPLRMLVWMANVGARSLGGLRAGALVTSGSSTGTIFVKPGCRVEAEYPGVGKATLRID
jgi:2-keto-4-pentenoate hydratase